MLLPSLYAEVFETGSSGRNARYIAQMQCRRALYSNQRAADTRPCHAARLHYTHSRVFIACAWQGGGCGSGGLRGPDTQLRTLGRSHPECCHIFSSHGCASSTPARRTLPRPTAPDSTRDTGRSQRRLLPQAGAGRRPLGRDGRAAAAGAAGDCGGRARGAAPAPAPAAAAGGSGGRPHPAPCLSRCVSECDGPRLSRLRCGVCGDAPVEAAGAAKYQFPRCKLSPPPGRSAGRLCASRASVPQA